MLAAATGRLAGFQDAFARALLSTHAPTDPAIASLTAQPAFAVYRNTVTKGCIDALQANFPAVTRLVGEEWFRAAAAAYVARELPTEPSLLTYGTTFPAFLSGFLPAAELPYLPDVARLDCLWTEVHTAADEPALGLAAIAGLAPETLATAVLHAHPAARWAWFPDAPIPTIWSRNRTVGCGAGELAWRGEGVLVTRPRDEVRWVAIDVAGFEFLEACTLGLPIAHAANAALEADADANLVAILSALLEAGAFVRLGFPHDTSTQRTSP